MITPDEIRRVPMFAKIEDEGLEWLCDNGNEVWLEAGQTLREEGQLAEHVFLILDGAIRITQRIGNQEEILITYDKPTIFGEIPVLMGTPRFWASSRAIRRTHVLELPVALFWQMLGRCPIVTTEILRTMAERIQSVQALTQQRERLASLGTLAAGLAHELNNPAAAARRAAHQLGDVLSESRRRACKLKASDWTTEQRHYITELQDQISQYCRISPAIDPLVQSDREQEVADWLDRHVVADSWELAPTLVSAGFDCAKLDDVAEHIPAASLEDALYWIGAGATVDGLVAEVQTSADRIGSLVDAMKSYTYLDRGDMQEVDVREGLESTITVLGAKLNDVEIIREYAPGLPRICAYGSELNQVWSHLLTNAVDAVHGQRNLNAPERANGHDGDRPETGDERQATTENTTADAGKIWIRTIHEGNTLCVEIADNGPGISAEQMAHIFEPFFTTKDIGLGTGMGLVVSRRIIVERHGGDMQVHSEPGYTCFEVRLPFRQEAQS